MRPSMGFFTNFTRINPIVLDDLEPTPITSLSTDLPQFSLQPHEVNHLKAVLLPASYVDEYDWRGLNDVVDYKETPV
jgi:hypothetical protein